MSAFRLFQAKTPTFDADVDICISCRDSRECYLQTLLSLALGCTIVVRQNNPPPHYLLLSSKCALVFTVAGKREQLDRTLAYSIIWPCYASRWCDPQIFTPRLATDSD